VLHFSQHPRADAQFLPARITRLTRVSGRQLLQQGLRLLQIARVEAFSEPAVNRSKQFARLLRSALITPEPSQARRRAEFPGLSLLVTRDSERALEIVMATSAPAHDAAAGGRAIRRRGSDACWACPA
jgi:hypothetical protein